MKNHNRQSDISLLNELDKLKTIYRKSYVGDGSRHENSAEHSWHLALSFMALKHWLPGQLDIDHAILMALLHDVCEIGAGDVCAYDANPSKAEDEAAYLNQLRTRFPGFGDHTLTLWQEYEAQETLESQWVKVFDKLLPFLLNLANEGRTWREQHISAEQFIRHNAFIHHMAPELYEWMLMEIDQAAAKGWFSS